MSPVIFVLVLQVNISQSICCVGRFLCGIEDMFCGMRCINKPLVPR